MISSIANLVYELPREMPNDLRLRILRNKEISGKSQIWMERCLIRPSVQSPLQKLNFGSSSQKTRKSRYQTCLVLSSFTGFFYFVPNILPWIVGSLTISGDARKRSQLICLINPRSNLFEDNPYKESIAWEIKNN